MQHVGNVPADISKLRVFLQTYFYFINSFSIDDGKVLVGG